MVGVFRMKMAAALLLAVLAFVRPDRAGAHPHVWIDVVTDILFDENGDMTGLKHSWTFDESYSVLAVQGLDKNRDGKFTTAELEPLLKNSMNSLGEWDYFSAITINGRNVPLKHMRNAKVRYEKGKIILEFELLVDAPVKSSAAIRFSVYDRSFYNLVTFAEEDPIWLGRNAPEHCSFMIEPAKRGDRDTATVDDSYIESLGDDVNYGAQFAEWVSVDCAAEAP